MKLYKVTEKSKDEEHLATKVFMLFDGGCPKEHIKMHCYFDADLRTLKELETPKGLYIGHNLNGDHFVCYDGSLEIHYSDDAVNDYPKDLIWSRDISSLVYQAIELGQKMGRAGDYRIPVGERDK